MRGFILGVITTILVIGFMAIVANAAEVNVSVKVEEDHEMVEEYFEDFTEGVYDFFESLED